MESGSETSHSKISSESVSINEVPNLNLEEFIKDEYAQKLSLHSEKGHKNLKIFTVAQTLKDP